MENVRSFQSTLTKAFDEFNLKFILFKMYYSLSLPFLDDFEEKSKVQERIIKAFGGKHPLLGERFNALDSAYYSTGRRFFSQAGQYWEKLSKSDFGRLFILSPEEDKEAMKRVFK